MRRGHFEALQPRCPLCLQRGVESGLALARVAREADGHVLEGAVRCAGGCLAEYPILDGIPILVADVRSFVSQSAIQILARRDLDAATESLIGDCCGPGSDFETTRYHMSTYCWGHYADLDPQEPVEASAVGALLELGWSRLPAAPNSEGPISGTAIDVGCAVGRGAFELAARTEGLVLGVDLNFSLIQQAARILREGEVGYPRRRVGLVYDRRRFPAALPGAERVDFWACDAQVLPFAAGQFDAALSLNVLDCMGSPWEHLRALGRVLSTGGRLVLATPYDWSVNATPLAAWIGGHSQRGASGGASEVVLRALLAGEHPAGSAGLRILDEIEDAPWPVRVHDRSTNLYRTHVVLAEAT